MLIANSKDAVYSDTGMSMQELAQRYFQPSYGHLINGEWVGGASGKTIAVTNPSNGDVLSHIQAGNPEDAKRAIAAASAAFPAWSATHPLERGRILKEMARRLRARQFDYGMMETLDNGKTITDSSTHDVLGTAGVYENYGGAVLTVAGETRKFPNALSLTMREPLGVCVAIVPWNIPLLATALKVGPALAAGNTVVLKPAESVCLSLLEFFKECQDILPPGVVNIVTGYGPDVGEALVSDPRVRKVAFTGSRPTAKKIMSYATQNIIPSTMELGGKSANIICQDANIDAAVESAVFTTVFLKGEVCIAGTRTFVHASIYDEFLEKFRQGLGKIKQGDPTRPETQIGPQASQIQFDKVCSYLDLGRQEGARLVAGGDVARIDGLEQGLFIQPTIFADVRNDMRIAQEEIFGPVNCVLRWEDDEEVIRMANESSYGLGGGVWTRDINRAHNMAGRMETGTVWINRYFNMMPGQPLGGYKESGFGREGCLETLDHYTQLKAVIMNFDEGTLGLYD